jgi:hypothetical protein
VIEPGEIELDRRRVLPGVIRANLLDQPTVARATFIGGNDTIMRRLLASAAGESESDGHVLDPWWGLVVSQRVRVSITQAIVKAKLLLPKSDKKPWFTASEVLRLARRFLQRSRHPASGVRRQAEVPSQRDVQRLTAAWRVQLRQNPQTVGFSR